MEKHLLYFGQVLKLLYTLWFSSIAVFNPVNIKIFLTREILFEKLKEAIPDLLFLDIEMPCKDGIACILEIRRDPRYNYMPVVMYTSHSNPRYISSSYQNGANYFLIKPSTVKALQEKLEIIFSRLRKEQLYFPTMHEFVLSS